jgi:protein-S-isoprenylcysteine O-methyltransferase Ste14
MPSDVIDRNIKRTNYAGLATFVGLRAADPFLQYQILRNDWGQSLIQKLGGTTLPRGPPLVTNTPLDNVIGLSPYRTIILAMSIGSMLKQNLVATTITQEEVAPKMGVFVGGFNAAMNSMNSLLFVCSQTSASVNGEHFPQTPLIVGASLYVLGMTLELGSEVQRAMFKKDPANKGKIYEGGLFGLSRHINYFGYMLWRGGYALAAGGWLWGAAIAGFFAYDFTTRAIPVLQEYLEGRVYMTLQCLDQAFTNDSYSMANSTNTTSRPYHIGLCRSCTNQDLREGHARRVVCVGL